MTLRTVSAEATEAFQLPRLIQLTPNLYAASFMLGVVTVLGYYVWRFVQTTNF